MKKHLISILCSMCFVFLASVSAFAQIDVSAGYARLMNSEPELNNAVVDADFYFHKNVAVNVDFMSGSTNIGEVHFNNLNVNFGLKAAKGFGLAKLYVKGGIGVSNLRGSMESYYLDMGDNELHAYERTESFTSFSQMVGAGVDWKVNHYISIRAPFADYYGFTTQGVRGNGVRVGAGVVVHVK